MHHLAKLLALAVALALPGLAFAAPPEPTPAKPAPKSSKSKPAKDKKAAGKPQDKPQDKPMTVQIVRSAQEGCEPSCPEWIAAQGRIDATSPPRFKNVLAQLKGRKLPVLIASGGGSVDDAIAIGKLIREKGLDVVVSRSEVHECAAADTACRKQRAKGAPPPATPRAKVAVCASSCTFILAGGVRRYTSPLTLVGVHRLKSYQILTTYQRTYQVQKQTQWGIPVETKQTLVDQRKVAERKVDTATKASTYEKVRQHFADMGVQPAIMTPLMQTPHEKVYWLTQSELLTMRLSTDTSDGEQLLLGAPPPSKAQADAIERAIRKSNPPVARSAPARPDAFKPDPTKPPAPTCGTFGGAAMGCTAPPPAASAPQATPAIPPSPAR